MKKALALALVMTGPGGQRTRCGLDLPKVPDPLPDSLTRYGVTLYATLDYGFALFQTNGCPTGSVVSTLEFISFTTTRNYTGQSISTIAGNGLQQSNIGLKIDTPIGMGWNIVGRLETGIDPLSGELANGCVSFIQNAGASPGVLQQNSNADRRSLRSGFERAGLRRRQQPALRHDGRWSAAVLPARTISAAYDPLELSYAFSLLGYSGTNGGMGSTEAARWDNSAKYVYDFGPVHAGVMYSGRRFEHRLFRKRLWLRCRRHLQGLCDRRRLHQGTRRGELADGGERYRRRYDAGGQHLRDNTEWSPAAGHTWDIGRPTAPSMYTSAAKAEPQCDSKLTLYAGYTYIDQANPNTPVTFGGAAGGFPLTISPTLPDNNAFTTDKILQFYWTGLKYEFMGLSITGAYYHVNQNSYIADSKPCVAGGASKTDCAGVFDQVPSLRTTR